MIQVSTRGFARGRIRQEAQHIMDIMTECDWQPDCEQREAVKVHAGCLRGHIENAELTAMRSEDANRMVENLMKGKHTCVKNVLYWLTSHL